MLSGDERPDAGRLAAAAWEALAPLVHLTLDETAFFAAIDQGDLRLELLFPDDAAEAIRLALHPALQWKITNARGWLAGHLSLIHISEPTRRTPISYAVFCLKKKKKK